MTAAVHGVEATGWFPRLDVDAVLRGQGADPVRVRARSPRLVALAERALLEGKPLLVPAIVSRRYAVLSRNHTGLRFRGGSGLSSRLIATGCAPAEELIVMAVTIGAGLETATAAAMNREPGFGLALDGLGTAAVEALASAATDRITVMAAAMGSCAGPPLSPGMEGWPLQPGQRDLFRLLGEGNLPIQLHASGMMAPAKSLTLVVGLGPAMRAGASHCEFCPSRDRCRHRQVS
ncbi:MAG: hypothetical protein SGJ01_01435 [Gemmatimonadota bacterium]|nr:hypothetical protein [Gemmatimonadota bacterium]